jgi:uncharacterized membrane protein HdeD (DUF308 family)
MRDVIRCDIFHIQEAEMLGMATSNKMFLNWWAVLLRGLISIIFGVLVLAFPGSAFVSLIWVIGAYIVIDGVAAVGSALMHREHYPHWWVTLIEGLVGIVAGILALVYPGLAGVTLVTIIAFWAIVTGVVEIVAAWRLRQTIKGELFLGLSGLVSVIFGVVVLFQPGVGILALLTLIGVYSVIFGVMLIFLAFRLRSHHLNTGTINAAGTSTK